MIQANPHSVFIPKFVYKLNGCIQLMVLGDHYLIPIRLKQVFAVALQDHRYMVTPIKLIPHENRNFQFQIAMYCFAFAGPFHHRVN